jgi:PAS domain-containing protein
MISRMRSMDNQDWDLEFPAAITVCDAQGIILRMNDAAVKTFEKDGGIKLLGTNTLDCHPEPARTRVKDMLASGQKNVYSIEKNGVKKLIFQSPWYRDGLYAGFVEISMEIPMEIPHFIRA